VCACACACVCVCVCVCVWGGGWVGGWVDERERECVCMISRAQSYNLSVLRSKKLKPLNIENRYIDSPVLYQALFIFQPISLPWKAGN